MLNNLKIELDPRLDKEEEVYHIGRLKAPVSIDLTYGVTFLVFLSEDGEEELQIAVNDKENTTFNKYKLINNKMKINLERRTDQDERVYYLCKVRHPGKIDCINEACFLVFTSRENNESLQITGEIRSDGDKSSKPRKKEVEVIRR